MISKIKGVTGELRHGYQTAAKLNGWTVANGVLESGLTDVNRLWLARRPLIARLDVGRLRWEFDVLEVMATEPSFRARVEMPPK